MSVTDMFASNVFNDAVMQEYLSPETYVELKRCIDEDESLTPKMADEIAGAMKDWAVSKGVTHYTHWFQPMNDMTAEKHDAFISPTNGGSIILEFSGKELIKGESDASSFPSGGLRATFEARGYTAWDPTSFAFIKGGTLCIPTAFCSYTGEALDKKTPLLRSMEVINRQSLRVLKLFGKTNVKRVISSVGAEQEYFLLDRKLYEKRKDLVYTGRTLFGAASPKGQELDDHYFGPIKTKVSNYMKELDEELWKLGILAKTEHNEVAPAQHELAPIYSTVNIATDHNQLTMEIMKRVAVKHGMACVLHEKPFKGINGSGKHNNWSLVTDTGVNLLEPGNNPYDNAQFLLFLCSVIKAVDEYQDLMRISVASASNDNRLGGNEAPPAIVSIFLGDELTGILEAIAEDRNYSMRAKCNVEIGVSVLPKLSKDSTDRNRTSPFAFTGNKFEFRMVGSCQSIAGPNLILNTIVAEALKQYADELEKASDLTQGIKNIIKETMNEHKRIIFNGNNYSEEWLRESERRGLLNLRTAVDALPYYTSDKNIQLFNAHCIFSEHELYSRRDIMMQNYCNIVNIESKTMIDMMKRDILPSVLTYINELSATVMNLKSAGVNSSVMVENLAKITDLYELGNKRTKALEGGVEMLDTVDDVAAEGRMYRDTVIPLMQQLREVADEMETITPSKYWGFPVYGDILFGMN